MSNMNMAKAIAWYILGACGIIAFLYFHDSKPVVDVHQNVPVQTDR